MSLKSSIFDSLRYKLHNKNIIIFKGNVTETIIPTMLNIEMPKFSERFAKDYKIENNQINPFEKNGSVISFKEYLAAFLYEFGFENIKYFSTSLNKIEIKNGVFISKEKNEKNENEFSNTNSFNLDNDTYDPFSDNDQLIDDGNVKVASLTDFIDEIENDINTFYYNRTAMHKAKYAYIIDLSEFIISERNTQLNLNDISRLLNIFTSFLQLNIAQFFDFDIKLIFIVNNDDFFSSLLFNKNLEILNHNIELPDKNEREKFIKLLNRLLNIVDNESNDDFNYAISITQGYSLREILQFAKVKDKLTFEHKNYEDKEEIKDFKNLYRLIKFDKKDSEWEKMNYEKIKNLEDFFKNKIKGQNLAIKKVKESIIRSFLGLQGIQQSDNFTSNKPRGVLFLVGPTGVGKTELAKTLSEFVFGDKNRIIRFDMSEYNHEESDQKLIGAAPGYVGYEQGGKLINEVLAKPFSILLFDEIEKANGKILDKFLQILEDGRLTSSKGELADFSETFIIFTSNLGASTIKTDFSEEETIKHFKNSVTDYFINKLGRPEILNRIGLKNIVPFTLIKNEEVIHEIIKSKIELVVNNFEKQKNITIKPETDEDLQKLINFIKSKYNPAMGARGLITNIESIFIDNLSSFIFENWNELNKDENKENKEIKYLITNKEIKFLIQN
ncbi:AAA family ATPase [Mycoplasmopsis gallinarum]